MVRTRTWTIEINIIEHEDERRTRADVILRGEGGARWRSSDQEAPESGDEQVTARALADLAYKALDVAAADVDQFAHRHMRMLS
jgi:hypothetical protein